MDFKNRLLALRKKLNLTQAQFARPLGVNRGYIATLETSDKEPSESLLRLISYEYCTSYAWLKNGEGEMFISPEEVIKGIINRFGEKAILDAFHKMFETATSDVINVKDYTRRAYDKEPELKRMVDVLYTIFSAGDERLKTWASVQFDRAFPADVVEDAQKKATEIHGQASAG